MVNGDPVSPYRRSQFRSPIGVILERIVYLVFGVIEVFIAVRFVLKLLGANPVAGFVQFVYAVSDFFMIPFNAIFPAQRVSGTTFEWSALVAILVYALIAAGLVALIRALSPGQPA
jgi:hypothetical protein